MNKEVLISVVMPAYNAAEYIQQAIQSILDQTFVQFELIIINDGSTDNTLQIIQSFSDSRIVLMNFESNKGNRVAANAGLDAAKGKYIVRMDADDVSVKERLVWQYDFMESNLEIGFSGGHIQLFGADHNLWKYPVSKEELQCAFVFGTPVVQGASIIRKEALDNAGIRYAIDGHSYAEDVDFFYRFSQHTKYANLDKVLLHYRRHPQNITSQLADRGLELNKPLLKRILTAYGLDPTEADLEAHLWLNSRFLNKVTQENIILIHQWKQKLQVWNSEVQRFPVNYFNQLLADKWNRLFYLLADKGFKWVKSYMRAQNNWETQKLIYFLKRKLRGK